jgi:hypothetical protein
LGWWLTQSLLYKIDRQLHSWTKSLCSIPHNLTTPQTLLEHWRSVGINSEHNARLANVRSYDFEPSVFMLAFMVGVSFLVHFYLKVAVCKNKE